MSKGYLHTRCTGLIKYDSRSSERDCGNDFTPIWNTKADVSTCDDRIRVWKAIQRYVRSQNSLNSGYSENFLCTKSRVPSWSMTYVVYTCEYSSFERNKRKTMILIRTKRIYSTHFQIGANAHKRLADADTRVRLRWLEHFQNFLV